MSDHEYGSGMNARIPHPLAPKKKEKICPHCKGPIALRNPKGFCDHLYYPDNCKVCSKKNRNASHPGKIEPVYREIGARIRRLREKLKLSQPEFASRIGYQRPTLVNFENGKRRISIHRLEKVALALGITPKELMKGIWW